MRRSGAIVLVVFAAILATWWAVLLLWRTDALPTALLGGSVSGLLVAFLIFQLSAARRRPPSVRAVPDLSFGAVGLAFGVTALVVGADVGQWLLLIGAAVTAGSLAQLGREWAAARRAVAAAARARRPA
jgi:hypothetical protein